MTEDKQPNYPMYEAVTESFRQLMIKELAANHDKGDREGDHGWINGMNNKDYVSEIYYHTGKLQQALKDNDVDKIKEYSADIANGALMCCDKFYKLAPYPFDNQ